MRTFWFCAPFVEIVNKKSGHKLKLIAHLKKLILLYINLKILFDHMLNVPGHNVLMQKCAFYCVLPLCVTSSTYPPIGDPYSLLEEAHKPEANLNLNSCFQFYPYILSTLLYARHVSVSWN